MQRGLLDRKSVTVGRMEVTTRSTFVEGSTLLLARPRPRPHWHLHPPSSSSLRFVVTAFNIRLGGKSCGKCRGKGAVECPGCKGSGRNKKNGNLFERWKCFDCQGFGLLSCPSCGKGGLTPEQRGER